jgi:hypothetical protein
MFIVVCLQLHPFNQQRPIVEYCKKHNIAVQAYCPIVQGQLNHPEIQRLATKVIITSPSPVIHLLIAAVAYLAVWPRRRTGSPTLASSERPRPPAKVGNALSDSLERASVRL